ncbi:MAG: oligosaccharide flippase family protein [Oleispira sp.]
MKFLNSAKWVLLGSGGQQGLGFLVFLLLSYLLVPEDFGVYALCLVFIEICNQLSRLGLSIELISSNEEKEGKYLNAFWLTLSAGVLLSASIATSAEFWQDLLGFGGLAECLVVAAIIPIIYSLNCIPDAIYQREFRHKNLAVAKLSANTLSGVIALSAAYFLDMGFFALVLQRIVTEAFTLLFFWLNIEWRPRLKFYPSLALSQLKNGLPFLGSGFVTLASYKSKDVFIGVFFGPIILGYFRLALKIQDMLNKLIFSPVSVVLLPYLAQTNRSDFNDVLARILFTTVLIVTPMYAGMAAVAHDFISVVFSDEWQPASELLIILCLFGIFSQVFFMFKPILGALGQGYELIKIVMLYCLTLNALMIAFAQNDIEIVLWVDIFAVIIASLYGLLKVKKVAGLSLVQLGMDIMPSIIATMQMSVIIFVSNTYIFIPLEVNSVISIILKIILGIVSYVLVFRLIFKNQLTSKLQPLLSGKVKKIFERVLFLN